jgi:hypothetical protein
MDEQEKLRNMRIISSELDSKTEREWEKDSPITSLEQIAEDIFPITNAVCRELNREYLAS